MGLKTRKLLFLFFVLAFLVITPLVSLYAAGYKISLSGKILQKTGMLIIDSNPDEATILIDNKVQQNFLNKIRSKFSASNEKNIIKTPAKIKSLIPGEYTVKLVKDGYWSWEKKLQIYPGNSTFAEDIVMFRNNLPQPIISEEINNLKESPNKKTLAFIGSDKYYTYNTDNEEMLFYTKDKNTKNKIKWLNDEMLLFDNLLFSLDSWNKPDDLSSILKNIKNPNIQLKDPNTIYYQKNNHIIELNLKNKAIKTILQSPKILDYLIKDNLIYTIEKINNNIFLIVYNNKNIIRKINLNYDDNYVFVNAKSKLINIYNKKYDTLYLVEALNYYSPLKETINDVLNSFWVSDNKLVYYNDYEIWIYDLVNNKKILLTRISEKINNVLWHPSNNYIIYSSNQSLFTIELDNRDKYSTNHLIRLQNIDYLSINTKGDNLYFYAQLGKQFSLFKLAI